jgi:RNA polymerase sigma-70 factor (ECF subfamily)
LRFAAKMPRASLAIAGAVTFLLMPPLPAPRDPPMATLRLVSGGSSAAPRAEDDDDLIASFERGAPGAGLRLYERLLPIVDATIYRILGRREPEHADLVQSAFEQIVTTLGKRTYARGCSLAGWAAVIACHVGLNAVRSRRRERGVLDRDRAVEAQSSPDRGAGRDPEAQIRARYDLEAVRRHLVEMDPDRATAVVLHAQGYDLVEIAKLTRVSVAAAQSRLSRGRREMRDRLEGGGSGRVREEEP